MISLLEPSGGTGDNPQQIEHLPNYYAYIMRDSKGIMDSGEAIFTAQAQVVFFLLCGVCARRSGSHTPAHDNMTSLNVSATGPISGNPHL